MVKNIMALIILGFALGLLSSCAGVLPEKPWHVYRAEQEALEQQVVEEKQEIQAQEERRNGGTEIRNIYLPGEVIRNNSSVGPFSGGIEVHEENYRDEERLVITPFLGKESPNYNKGYGEEKRRARILKKHNERQQVVDWAREDALEGIKKYEGISGEYWSLYNDEFERTSRNFDRRDQNRYFQDERRRGQEEFRQKHPEYAKAARVIDQVKEQARKDAIEGYFKPPIDGRFKKDYIDAYNKEEKRLEREYRRQHDRRQ